MTWRRDPRSHREIGDFTIWSETNPDRETAHVVKFPDGRKLRVLPDARNGHMRAQIVRQVVEPVAASNGRLVADFGYLVVVGGLSVAGLEVEDVDEVCETCGRPL